MKLRFVAFAFAATAIAAPAMAAPISGARVEGVIGYDHVNIDLEGDDEGTGGVLYGLGVGYDFAVSPTFAVGVDAEITDSTADVGDEETGKVSAARDLYVGGRFTTAISDTFNLYGKLGYTNARLKVEFDGESLGENGDGIRAGIGGQFALGANSYIGTEYRYSNYEGGFERHQLAGTVGFRF